MAKQFRMVPEDAAEAKYISDLVQRDIAANLPELNKDLKLLRKRLEIAERWEGIAEDLAEDGDASGDGQATPPGRVTAPATAAPTAKPRATARPAGADSTDKTS